MKRREFIIALGCAAVWPLAALAQQAASRIVGVLGSGSLDAVRTSFAPAQRRLAEMGYVEGRNLALEYRWADNQEDRLAALAGDLVRRPGGRDCCTYRAVNRCREGRHHIYSNHFLYGL